MSEVIDHKERAHSEIGASSATRWLGCPASVSLSRGIAESSSSFASEGTAAHELSELCLETDTFSRQHVGAVINEYEVTEEMAQFVQYYLNAMEKYTNEDSGYDTFVEQRFSMPKIHKDMFGSNDFCAFGIENKEMVIVDFKYGAGIDVSAKENIQMIIYALGAYYEFNHIYDFKTVKLVIVQPRMEGGEYDEWEISIKELLKYQKILKAGVKEVYAPAPRIASGEHCRFCKAKATCPELKRQAEITTQLSFDAEPVESMPEVAKLTEKQIAVVLKNEKLIVDWMEAVKGHALDMLNRGETIEGFKLVAGTSRRAMTDKDKFIADFGETFEVLDTKLKGIGALEKLIGKQEIAPYFHKSEAPNCIAPESSKKKAIVAVTSTDLFEEEDKQLKYSGMEF